MKQVFPVEFEDIWAGVIHHRSLETVEKVE